MSEPFIAEIRIFPFNFAPRGWAFCSGQIIPIAQNTALFALLGTTYGGNGQSTYALPNLQGNVPMYAGSGSQGPGLSPHTLGETGGAETVTLQAAEMPSHTHSMSAATGAGNVNTPGIGLSLAQSDGGPAYQSDATGLVPLAGAAISPAANGKPHNNLMPYLALNFCIALQGIFPQRP